MVSSVQTTILKDVYEAPHMSGLQDVYNSHICNKWISHHVSVHGVAPTPLRQI